MSADAATVAQALGGAKRVAKGWVARCPAHNDRNPSLSLSDGERGQLVWHCHAGWRPEDRAEPADQARALRAGGGQGARTRTRTTSRPSTPTGTRTASTGLTLSGGTTPTAGRSGYGHGSRTGGWGSRPALARSTACRNCSRVTTARPCSSWKARRWRTLLPRCRNYSISPVTTSISGSKAAGHSDWSPLRSMEVLIWPDHDPAGFRYARDVASALKGQADVRFILVPQTFPQGWDLADPLPTGHTIESLLAEATNVLPEPEPEPEPEDEALAEVRAAALDGDWDLVRALAKANEPRLEERIFRARSIQDIVELERYATPDIEAVPWITFHDAAELPRPESVIEQRAGGTGALLTKGEVLLLTGPGKVGKSSVTLGLALARHHALNSDYAWGTACGLQIRAGRTFIASYEDSPAWVGYRVSKHWGTSLRSPAQAR